MAKCLRMVLFSLIAVAIMAGSALAVGSDPTANPVEIGACEVMGAGYFKESENTEGNTKNMGQVCLRLGAGYNPNDRTIWNLTTVPGGVPVKFKEPGEYFLVTQKDLQGSTFPGQWTCRPFSTPSAVAPGLKAWNMQSATGYDLDTIEFRVIAPSGNSWVIDASGNWIPALQEGIIWCLSRQCDFTEPWTAAQNIAIDTKWGEVCCESVKITERSDQWLIGGGYIEFDKKNPYGPKETIVMRSKSQFVGSRSDLGLEYNGIFDQEIYCPDRRYFADGARWDKYTKILCATTEDCGRSVCSWDTGLAITNPYTIAATDLITMTVTATGPIDPCLTPMVWPWAQSGGYPSCFASGNTFTCVISGANLQQYCPGWPNQPCPVPLKLKTDGTCSISPKSFKNTMDTFLVTGEGMVPKNWDLTPVEANKYAGLWTVNGRDWLIQGLNTVSGYGMNCFLNYADTAYMTNTVALYTSVEAAQSCQGDPAQCFGQTVALSDMYLGDLVANEQKRFDFGATPTAPAPGGTLTGPFGVVPYNRNAANTGEVWDFANSHAIVGAGLLKTTDRFLARVTLCAIDQYIGWKQGQSVVNWGDYTNDWPSGGVGSPYYNPMINVSLSCVQAQPAGTAPKRTVVVDQPKGFGWNP